jgi:hypothetical protein
VDIAVSACWWFKSRIFTVQAVGQDEDTGNKAFLQFYEKGVCIVMLSKLQITLRGFGFRLLARSMFPIMPRSLKPRALNLRHTGFFPIKARILAITQILLM